MIDKAITKIHFLNDWEEQWEEKRTNIWSSGFMTRQERQQYFL